MLGSAEQVGVTLVGAWIDAPAHTAYIVVETDSAQKIEELLSPTFEMANAQTSIVQDGLTMLQRRTAGQ